MLTRKLPAFCVALAGCVLLAAAATAQAPASRTDVTKGTGTVSTEQVSGEVVQIEGNNLLVKLSSGELKTFNVPEERKFVVDGKDLSVRDLRPGTTLTATVKTTTTPVTVRTKAVQSGTVWFVSPPRLVILTLPNGENKQYEVGDDVKFILRGRSATVYDLRKGMVVSAEKIVEAPDVEITTATTVVGHAPSAAVAASAPEAIPAAAPAAAQGVAPAAAPADVPAAAPIPSAGAAPSETPPATPAGEGSSSWMMWAGIIFLVVLVIVFGRNYLMRHA